MTSVLVVWVDNWLPLPTSLLKKRSLLLRTCIFRLDFTKNKRHQFHSTRRLTTMIYYRYCHHLIHVAEPYYWDKTWFLLYPVIWRRGHGKCTLIMNENSSGGYNSWMLSNCTRIESELSWGKKLSLFILVFW